MFNRGVSSVSGEQREIGAGLIPNWAKGDFSGEVTFLFQIGL